MSGVERPVFYFDFASPNAFMAHRVLPRIESRTGLWFDYTPVLLGGIFKLSGNQAPMAAFASVPLKLAYERRESERFLGRHGIAGFRMNPHFPGEQPAADAGRHGRASNGRAPRAGGGGLPLHVGGAAQDGRP